MKRTALLPVLLVLLLVEPARAALRLPHAPSSGQHVVDLADVISWEDEAEIQELGQKLEAELDKQLVVVSIRAMSDYGGTGMRLEDFAFRLFRYWDIGHPERSGHDFNRGILLLVSVADRQARIELGAGWKGEKDADSARIMSNLLVPAFKEGDYSGGLALGARALDRMVRGLSLPGTRLSLGRTAALGGGGALVLASVVSIFRSGTDGWGFNLWRAFFSVLWWMLRLIFTVLASSSHRRHGYGSERYCYRRSHHHHHEDSGFSLVGSLFSSSGGSSSSSSYRGSSGGSSWSNGSSGGGSRGGGASGSW